MPIYDQRDSVAGVCGVDLSLDWLVKELQDINHSSYEYGWVPFDLSHDTNFYTFIISHDGTYLAHPDERRVMQENVLEYIDQHNENDMDLFMKMTQMQRGQATMTIDGVWATVYYAPLVSTNWSMAIVVPKKAFIYPSLILIGLLAIITFIGLAIIYYLCRSNIRQLASPLSALARSTDEMARGNFDAPLPVIDHQDEVSELRDSFAAMRQSLEKYIEDIKQDTAKEAALNRDLNVAWKIQEAMLPRKFPPFPERSDIDLYGYLKPAKSIGGDLYDFFIRDEQLFFCIGDVSGKGIAAALVMSVIHYMFRVVSGHNNNPKSIIEVMNDYLAKENKSSMFCTFFLGVLDLKTYKLKYCNAGHELPILISSKVNSIPVDHNLALGLFDGLTYKSGEMQLSPCDVLLLCTDGLKDAIDQDENCFGKERIEESLRTVTNKRTAKAQDYIQRLVDDVAKFAKDAPQADDLTLLAIKVIGSDTDYV